MALIKTMNDGGSSSVLYTDRRQFYIKPEQFAELWPAVTPFTTFVMAASNSMTGLQDPLFKMFEHRNPWERQAFSINGASEGTVPNNDTGLASVTVDGAVGLASTPDTSWVGLEIEVWNEAKTTKKGVALVTAASGNDLTLKNLGTTAFDLEDNDYCTVIGNARGEGQTSPAAWSDELEVVWNSTQIFRTPVEITGTLYQAALRGANSELARLRAQKAAEHKMQMERAFMFGSSVIGTNLDGNGTFGDNYRTDGDSKAVRTTMGIISAIENYGVSTSTAEDQNIFDFSGGLTWNQFVDATEKIFQYLPNSGTRVAFCGPGAMSYFSKIDNAASKLKTGFNIQLSDMKVDQLGYNFKSLETPFGVIQLVYTPALKRERTNFMVLPSQDNIYHATYRPSSYRTNIKTDNGYDGIKDEYFSDEGIGMSLIESHALIKTPTA